MARIEFIPFWTYYAAANNVFGVSIWDCVLNVVLFMPLGLIVSLLYPSHSLKQVVLIGLASSCFIELSQFIFAKGIMQFDDLMHNTLDCFMGSAIAKLGMKKIRKINDTNPEGA